MRSARDTLSGGRLGSRAIALALALTVSMAPIASATVPAGTTSPLVRFAGIPILVVPLSAFPEQCRPTAGWRVRADDLLHDRYRLGSYPAAALPHDPRWTEDPFHGPNWVFLFHSLGYLDDLLLAWTSTGDVAYRDRAIALARDWIHDNPRVGARSPIAWSDHATALRAIALTCLADLTPDLVAPGTATPWLIEALHLHGATLADPHFYRNEGNHALNQAIGLLEIARVLNRDDWRVLAADRLERLVVASVDAEGVTNEQSVGYEAYNLQRYSIALNRLHTAGMTPSGGFDRLSLMPRFLADATLPDGTVEMLGDTQATRGSTGTGRPVAWYDAGFLFARTDPAGGEAPVDASFMSLRFGPGPRFHGHADGGSVTLYGWGSRLVVDPGMYAYERSRWRTYFKSRDAHNVVTVDGLAWPFRTGSELLDHTSGATFVHARVHTAGYPGVSDMRRVTFSRSLGYLLVEDRLDASAVRRFRQLWHLVDGSAPAVDGSSVVTHRQGGNLLIRQLVGHPVTSIVTGRSTPIQGWISYRYGTKVAAPVVESVLRGRHARFLTLLVPFAGAPDVTVRDLKLAADGYSLVVTVGGRSERVVVDGSNATITPLG